MNAFLKQGYVVEAMIPDDGVYFQKLCDLKIHCFSFLIDGKGVNPLKDFKLINLFKHDFAKIKPSLICSFTIKPNLYSSIAARKYGIPVIAGVTGLGTAFLQKNLLNKIAVHLYKFAFKNIGCVFFQNNDDKIFFDQLQIIPPKRMSFSLPGDGVDLQKFSYLGLHNNPNCQFLYSGRLIGDKGLYELVSAFRLVKQKYPFSSLVFIGNYFLGNPTAINNAQIQKWVSEGLISYLGMVDNVDEIIAGCDCMVLPSYREGMPRSLLEAASMGKPIITVDSIGCKDVVEDGVTGYMAKVKDVNSLAEAMIRFIELPFDKKVEMGVNGRRKMEREFDQKIVIDKYLEVAKKLLSH